MVNINSDRYFNIAKQASKLSDYPKIHIGACLIYKKQVLSIGYNSLTTHPMQKYYNQFRNDKTYKFDVDRQNNYLHAEMSCIVSSKHLTNIDWSKVHLYIYRNGMCRPCNSCMQAIIERGIKHIHYTDSDTNYVYEILETERERKNNDY